MSSWSYTKSGIPIGEPPRTMYMHWYWKDARTWHANDMAGCHMYALVAAWEAHVFIHTLTLEEYKHADTKRAHRRRDEVVKAYKEARLKRDLSREDIFVESKKRTASSLSLSLFALSHVCESTYVCVYIYTYIHIICSFPYVNVQSLAHKFDRDITHHFHTHQHHFSFAEDK